jgi:IS30 family transposase
VFGEAVSSGQCKELIMEASRVAVAGKITSELRHVLENLWRQGKTFVEIGLALGVDPSTVWREVGRNGSGRHGTKNPLGGRRRGRYLHGYRATWAQHKAAPRAARPKVRKLGVDGGLLRDLVVELLRDKFSPQEIAGQLRLVWADHPDMLVSHETIYQAIYLQGRGGLRELIDDSLRTGRRARRSQSRAAQAARSAIRGKPWVTEEVHISTRPAEVTDRAVPGHWEGDLLCGPRNQSAIITLVERKTRFTLLGALPLDHSSPEVISVIRSLFARLPRHLHRSLTWDQGVELAGYKTFGLAEDCKVYFCDPHSPWQRGTNENTNGLLRQYFPKSKFDFTHTTQAELDLVAASLNRRPRRTFLWKTPNQELNALLALTP